jgi:hypothetical protein
MGVPQGMETDAGDVPAVVLHFQRNHNPSHKHNSDSMGQKYVCFHIRMSCCFIDHTAVAQA